MSIIRFIITSLSMLAIIFSTNVSNVLADNDVKSTNTDTQEDILEVIREEDFLDIKKIELDKSNKVIPNSVKDVNINQRGVSVSDGTYLLNRGGGWVLGNDSSFVKSGFAAQNETLTILESKTTALQHTIIAGAGLELDFEIVKAAIELTYEHSIKTSDTITTGFELTAPPNKNLYAKTYSTFNRYDMVIVRNGAVIGHSSTYEPFGSWAKYITYNPGETVNQELLKERVNRCILGEPQELNINTSIAVNGVNPAGTQQIKSLDILFDFNQNVIKLANRNNAQIHAGFNQTKYFKFTLGDKNNVEKASMTMNGTDYSSNPKYDSMNEIGFEVGDIITIEHKEPFRLNIKGNISDGTNLTNVSYFRITQDGLKKADSLKDNEYIIRPKISLERPMGASYDDKIYTLDNTSGSYTRWYVSYNSDKDAYLLENKLKNEYVFSDENNVIGFIKNPQSNYHYWKIIDEKDGYVSIRNLQTGLALEVKDYGTTYRTPIIPAPYKGTDNQLFKLEKKQ